MHKLYINKLRIFINNYSDIFLINISTLFIGLFIYSLLNEQIEVLTAFIAIGISISFGIRQYKIENDKMFKELFIFFNDKYDSKFNESLNRIDDLTKANPNYELKVNQGADLDEPALIIDYLNLCAEEYLWFSKGRIDISVWRSWEAGMIYYLNIRSINRYILHEKPQKESYYGLFQRIGDRIENWNTTQPAVDSNDKK